MNNEKLMEYILKSKISKLEESLGFNLSVRIEAYGDEVENPYQLIIDENLESEIHRELADEIKSELKRMVFRISKEVEVDGKEVEIEITGEVEYVSANR